MTGLLRTMLALLLALGLLCAESPGQERRQVPARITFEHADGVFVNVGSRRGLQEGQEAWLRLDGLRAARVQVGGLKETSAFLRFVARNPAVERLPRGTDIELDLDPVREEEAPARPAEQRRPEPEIGPLTRAALEDGTKAPQRRQGVQDEEEGGEFLPLLSAGANGVTNPRDVLSGRFSFDQSSQWTSDAHQDYHRSRLRSSGSLLRVNGGPWNITWRGDLSARFGDGYERVRDFEEPRVDLYNLSAYRLFDDDSSLEFGRFVPRALPSIGRVDAVAGEKVFSSRWRGGAVLGVQTERKDGNLSLEEPLLAAYVAYGARADDGDEYSISAGFLASMFESELDRFALLIDQSARWGSLHLFSSTEADLDVGNAEFRDDAIRLTRQDVSARWIRDGLRPRIGVVHYERPDIEAQRDLLDDVILGEDEWYRDDAFTRTYAGLFIPLGAGFSVDLEGGYEFSDALDTEHWRGRLTKQGWFGNPAASVTLSVFDQNGVSEQGAGARLSASVPFANGRWFWMPSVGARITESDLVDDKRFEVVEGGLQLRWSPEKDWSLNASAVYIDSNGDTAVRALLGVEWRF